MKKFYRIVIASLTALLVFSGCGASSSVSEKMNDSLLVEGNDMILTENNEKNEFSSETSSEQIAESRKIIFTYQYRIETKNLDESVKAIEKALSDVQGYCQESNVNGNSENGGYASFVLRVPSDKIEAFLAGTDDFGSIISQSKNGQDVTSQYFDIEGRLSTLKIQQERLTELLKSASSLDDIIKLEKELADIRNDIESLTTNLKKYDNLIDYTTVKINIEQVSDYSDTEESFLADIKDAFTDSFSSALETAKAIIIMLIWILPYILVVGLIAAVVVFFCKKRMSKKNK